MKINRKKNVKRDDTISAFGRMDFEKLENIFNVQLFGLNEQETENELDNLRQEWLKYSREERQEIIDKYYPRYEYAKGGGVIQEYFEKYNQKMSGASEQTATYWVDGIEELSINEKKKLFEMISLKEKNSY